MKKIASVKFVWANRRQARWREWKAILSSEGNKMRFFVVALFAFLLVFPAAGAEITVSPSEGPAAAVSMTASVESVADMTAAKFQKADSQAGICLPGTGTDGSSLQLAQNCGQCGSAGCCRSRTCICENGPGGCGSCVSQ